MLKLLAILLVASLVCRVLLRAWPWQMLGLGTGEENAEQRARTLLGVGRNATQAEIVDAHRRLIARVHPDRGGTGKEAHEANAARDLLLARLKASGRDR